MSNSQPNTDTGVSRLSFRALDILDLNRYLTLATVDPEFDVWTSPVWYAFDKELNLFFNSPVDTRHTRNIKANQAVAFAIFNSTERPEVVDGIQARGKASELSTEADVRHAIQCYYARRYPDSGRRLNVDARLAKYISGPRRFFVVKIDEAFVVDLTPNVADARVLIPLSDIRDQLKSSG